MRRFVVAAAIAFFLSGPLLHAQGVAPGGPIGNSTGIGSGLGTPGGTGPSWPNGTQPPTLAPPPPPGGGGSGSSMGVPHYNSSTPRPLTYYESAPHKPSTVPLALPETPAPNMAFLRGCWRTDVFPYAQHQGLTTWCFNSQGVGHLMYTRIDQPDFFCHADAEAHYAQARLHLESRNMNCSEGTSPGELECHPNGATAECSGEGTGTVRLYRVR